MNGNERAAWLANLKAGDYVIVDTIRGKSVGTVDRLTPTTVIVKTGKYKYETRYRRQDGRERNTSAWSGTSIEPATADAIEDVRRQNRIKRFGAFDWRLLDNDELQVIAEIIDAASKRKSRSTP